MIPSLGVMYLIGTEAGRDNATHDHHCGSRCHRCFCGEGVFDTRYLGFSLFRSKLVVDSTLVALCLLLPSRPSSFSEQNTRGPRVPDKSETRGPGFELDILKSDEESPNKSEVLPPEREATRSHDRQR